MKYIVQKACYSKYNYNFKVKIVKNIANFHYGHSTPAGALSYSFPVPLFASLFFPDGLLD